MPTHNAKNRTIAARIAPPADCRSPRSNPLARRSGIVLSTLAAMTAAAALTTPAPAHDKCDSLANAATAAGVFWAPAAGFQVGYYVAKYIDESREANGGGPDVFDCGGAIDLSADDYAKITGDSDPNQYFYPYWKATAAFIEASRDFNLAKSRWQDLRRDVRSAKIEGDLDNANRLQALADAAHAETSIAFTAYENEHDTYAAAMDLASRIYAKNQLSLVPALTVADVVGTMQDSLDGNVPEFEIRFWVDIACVPPAYIDAEGILAPADRFVNDDVPPGTFMDASTLASPATILQEISGTLSTVVKGNLDRLLPDDFQDNLPLPVPCQGDLNGDGQVDSADIGVLLSRWGGCA